LFGNSYSPIIPNNFGLASKMPTFDICSRQFGIKIICDLLFAIVNREGHNIWPGGDGDVSRGDSLGQEKKSAR